MTRPVTEDPNTLANLVTGMGGTVIPGETFVFDLPLEKVREVVPRINDLGIRVKKIGEYVADHPTKLFSPITVARLELCRPEQKSVRLTEVFGE